MRRSFRLPALAVAVFALLLALTARGPASQPAFDLGPRTDVAPGVSLYHLTDPSLLEPAGPVSIWLLRVDVRQADIRAVLANDEIVDTETVPEMAVRHRALAAVNAGFFLLPSGDPSGIYKLGGQLVSDTRRPRGAVGIVRTDGGPRFVFGRVSATMSLRIRRRARPDATMAFAGVDTTRQVGKLMLFTPAYHAHTDTAAGGLEWVLDGSPLRVTGKLLTAGKTPIPRTGFVLSYGGPKAPFPLTSLQPGAQVTLETSYTPLDRSPDEWQRAHDIIGGAGLIARDGHFVDDWSVERFNAGFAEMRHPRTIIGTHPDGSVWLVAVDGRQPQVSFGMTLLEVRELSRRLGLTNALNLDGGGSTTMWAGGRTVNSPSDDKGPRKVSDALLVVPRARPRP